MGNDADDQADKATEPRTVSGYFRRPDTGEAELWHDVPTNEFGQPLHPLEGEESIEVRVTGDRRPEPRGPTRTLRVAPRVDPRTGHVAELPHWMRRHVREE